MSEFYGVLRGNRGQATRQGTNGSGIFTRANSWHSQVAVSYHPRDEHDTDDIRIDISDYCGNGALPTTVDLNVDLRHFKELTFTINGVEIPLRQMEALRGVFEAVKIVEPSC